MSRIWMFGGTGDVDLDVVTAVSEDILNGKVIVGPDGEPLTGTLALNGDAGDSMVLSGKTYYNTDPKQRRIGTMVNQGTKTATLNCGEMYTIPAGYHNGQGKVTAGSLEAQTEANATEGDIEFGKTAWVKGSKVTGTLVLSGTASDGEVLAGRTYYNKALKAKRTGTMTNQGAKTAALNCGGLYMIPAGYHNGQGKVTANSLASQTDANAAAGEILSGKTAWVKGVKITGNMGSMNGQTINPTKSQQVVSCSGKRMNGNVVVNPIPSSYEQPQSRKESANNVNAVGNKDFSSKTNKACRMPYIRINRPTSFPVRSVIIFSWTTTGAATFFQMDADDNAWFMDGNTWLGHENECYQLNKINLGATTYELPVCASGGVSYICTFKS